MMIGMHADRLGYKGGRREEDLPGEFVPRPVVCYRCDEDGPADGTYDSFGVCV